jgi:hypothetical protein
MDDYNRESSGKYLMPFKLRENLVRDGWQPDYRPSRSISNVGSVLLVHITHTKTAITVELVTDPSRTAMGFKFGLQNLGMPRSRQKTLSIALNRTPIHNHHP